MKSRTPQKKRVLKLRMENETRFRLIGISSHENDYRLVWAINNRLHAQFVRLDNLLVHNPKLEADLEFSRFAYRDEDKYLTYNLISNRCPDGYLFPEVRNLDFLIQIIGEITDAGVKEMVQKIKAEEIVSAVFILDPAKVKGISQVFHE